MDTFFLSASSLQYQQPLDIDGYPVRLGNIHAVPRGRHYDMPQAFNRDERWHYGGKSLHLDEFDTNLPQYSSYRDNVVNDNDGDESMDSPFPIESDVDMLSKEPLSSPTKPLSTTARPASSDKYTKADIPKFRNIRLDSIQIKSVVQHPNHIPRDFHYPVDRHYKELVSRCQLLERLPPPAKKRKFFGFDAQELLLNGALNCNPCRPSNLIYAPTLTMFREETFQDTPQSVLEVLKPALALAEFIVLKGNPKFWVDVACGMRVPDYERIQKEATRAERLIPVHQVTKAMMDTTVAKLQALGKRLVIRFETLDNVYGCCYHPIVVPVHRPLPGYLNHGQLWPSTERLKLPAPYPSNPWDQPAVIKLDSKLFAAAKRFSMQKFPDVAAKLRFTFFFAVNLLHELSHAFEAKCGHSHYYELISKDRSKSGAFSRAYFSRFVEPKYKHHETEMGAAFEYETFGGRVHPINHDFSMNYGLNVYLGGGKGYASGAGVNAMRDGQPFGRAIPMGYIEELHQQSYWDKPNQNGVMIPMCGPETYLMNSTSTKNWREHLLENDAAYGVNMLEQAFDEQTHISKRIKTMPPPLKPTPKSANDNRRRRLLQTKLRKYPKKADAAAAQIKADLIAQATLEEAKQRALELEEAVAAASTQDYAPASPTQPPIDERFHYINSSDHFSYAPPNPHLDPTSDLYDPLNKHHHHLTLNDKWLLLEDYAILAHGWSSSTFLAKRATMASAVPPSTGLEPIPKSMIPSTEEGDWGELQCGMLRVLRERNPGRGFMVERAARSREREARKDLWRVKREMEELVVRKGGSRVEWMRGRADFGELGLEGMDLVNWEEGGWRDMLEELREQERVRVNGEMKGENVAADEVGTGDSGRQVQGNKITKYLRDDRAVADKAAEGGVGTADDAATSPGRVEVECCA